VRSYEERRCSILGQTQSRISQSILYITEYTLVYEDKRQDLGGEEDAEGAEHGRDHHRSIGIGIL